MRRRRPPLGVVVPAGMLALVCTLGVLQYRWLGQVSEAEAEQLRTSLAHSVQEFAADFDREVSAIYLALQAVPADVLDAGDATDLGERLARWRESARFPELVSDVYVVRSGDSGPTLSAYDRKAGTLTATDWPVELTAVRDRLTPPPPAPEEDGTIRRVFELRLAPIMPDVPAVVVPLYRPTATASFGVAGRVRRLESTDLEDVLSEFHVNRDVIVVMLDSVHLRQTMLPALAGRHFGAGGADRYRVSVVDREAGPVFGQNLPEGDVISADQADVTAPFFRFRLNAIRPAVAAAPPHVMAWSVTRADEAASNPVRTGIPAEDSRNLTVIMSEEAIASPMAQVAESTSMTFRLAPEGWEVRAQHADGSLEAAVANARSRNLWLAFGMLALLVASGALVVVNAQRSERLAARQMDFVATVSHELRTPLAVIRSAAQNLQAGVVLDRDQTTRYGDLIEGEGRRLTDMIEQVLEYAGVSGGRQLPRAHPVDIQAVARDALDGCRALLDDQGVEVSFDVPAGLPPVMADEDALRRAVQNLVTNALKYAADGRWIGIRAETASSRGRSEVRLSVADRGRGIDAEDLPHIFEPFYRGRDARERQVHGNGLGLSLVRRIAEAHGGKLTVKSAPGQGATFTIALPVVAGDPAAAGEPAATLAPNGRGA